MILNKRNFLAAFLLLLASTSLLGRDRLPDGANPGKRGFLENQGQWPEDALFRGAASGFAVKFQRDGVAFMSSREAEEMGHEEEEHEEMEHEEEEEEEVYDVYVWKMRFAEALPGIEVKAKDVVAARTNYFIGDDPAKWRTRVPEYRELTYLEVWPGIDVRFFLAENGALKYEFLLAPGADPDQIQIEFEGLDGLEILESGRLQLNHPWGAVTEDVPVAFTAKETQDVPVKFKKTGANSYGFAFAGKVPQHESWVIDPLLLYWSTFTLSSQGGAYYAYDVSYDATGHLYLTGTTGPAFPATPGAYQTLYGGFSSDAYVAKFSPDGSNLVFMTYLGGSSGDISNSIAVNAAGRIYICGRSGSPNFPITPGAFANNTATGYSPFAAALSGDGTSLIYSTDFCQGCLGNALGLASVSNDEVIITGIYSTNANAPFPTTPGAFMTTALGGGDGWVLRLNATGSALVWSTLLASPGADYLYDVAVNDLEEPYVVGYSANPTFPITPGAFQTTPGQSLVARLNANGTGLIYSSWFANNGNLRGIDVHPVSREAFVTGTVTSGSYTTTPGAFQTVGGGTVDAVVARINAAGSALIYSTYLGGSDLDNGIGIAVKENNEVYVSGFTRSSNFPFTTCQYQSTHAGERDMFLAHFGPMGNTLASGGAAIFGGQEQDYYNPRVEVREDGPQDTLFCVLTSHSPGFPTTPGAWSTIKLNGTSDLQVAMKLVTFAADIPDTVNCGTTSIDLSLPTACTNILWSTNDTTASISVSQSGTYWASWTLYNCSYADTFNVVVDSFSVDLGPDTTFCQSNPISVNLVAGQGTGWLWSTNATGPSIVANQPGTYWVVASDSVSGCTAVDSVTLLQEPDPVVNLPTQGLCSGDSLLLNLDPANQYPGATYLWSTSDTSQQIWVHGGGWVWGELTNAAGCTTRDSSLIPLYPLPQPALGPDTTYCGAGNYLADAGPGFANYLWSDNSTGQTASFSQSGWIWVEVVDTNGCVNRDSMLLTINPPPAFSLGPDLSLCDSSAYTVDAGPGFATYLWSNGAVTAATSFTQSGWVWAEITDANGCIVRDSILLQLGPEPDPQLGPDTLLCGGQTLLLDPQLSGSGLTYAWSNGATSPTLSVNTTGLYWVEVTDLSSGCIGRDTIDVGLFANANALLPADTLLCDQDSFLLAPGAFDTYQWSDGSTGADLLVTGDGLYAVTVSNGGLCFDSAMTRIDFGRRPVVDLGPDLELCRTDPRLLGITPGPGETVRWSTGSTATQIEALVSGDYWVEVENECGKTVDSLQVTFIQELIEPFLPNVFSPNDDGVNDCFRVENPRVESFWVQIFDRWGRLMYEIRDPNDCWDGMYRDTPAPEGVYYYVVRLRACNGEAVTESRNLTLIR